MSQITIFFIASPIIGILLIAAAFIFKNDAKDETYRYTDDVNLLSDKVLKAVDEADEALEQLTSMSANIFSELEGKYNELLFLYQLIEDKRTETLNAVSKAPENNKVERMEEPPASNQDPRFVEIYSRFDKGTPVATIAKELGIGQGEVKFILEMGKQIRK